MQCKDCGIPLTKGRRARTCNKCTTNRYHAIKEKLARMPEGTKRIVWKHKADTLSKIELERLIDHLQAQEQDGGNVSYDLYHLTKYAELKGLYLQEGLLNGK